MAVCLSARPSGWAGWAGWAGLVVFRRVLPDFLRIIRMSPILRGSVHALPHTHHTHLFSTHLPTL